MKKTRRINRFIVILILITFGMQPFYGCRSYMLIEDLPSEKLAIRIGRKNNKIEIGLRKKGEYFFLRSQKYPEKIYWTHGGNTVEYHEVKYYEPLNWVYISRRSSQAPARCDIKYFADTCVRLVEDMGMFYHYTPDSTYALDLYLIIKDSSCYNYNSIREYLLNLHLLDMPFEDANLQTDYYH